MGSQSRRLRRRGATVGALDLQLDTAINAAYARPLPPYLCHYTDRAGALGILEQRLVRATEAANQEDVSELRHADQIVETVAQRFADDRRLPNQERLWFEDLARTWRDVGPVTVATRDVFIACFTERFDNELLWGTRYAREDRGYALEFKVLKESLTLPLLGLTWGAVEYDRDRAEARLVAALSGVLDSWLHSKDRSYAAQRIARRALWLAGCYSAIFTKAPTFANEQEWRMAVVTYKRATIVKAPRRCVEVQLRQDNSRPELQAIHIGKLAPGEAEVEMANALMAMGYPTVPLKRRF